MDVAPFRAARATSLVFSAIAVLLAASLVASEPARAQGGSSRANPILADYEGPTHVQFPFGVDGLRAPVALSAVVAADGQNLTQTAVHFTDLSTGNELCTAPSVSTASQPAPTR